MKIFKKLLFIIISGAILFLTGCAGTVDPKA